MVAAPANPILVQLPMLHALKADLVWVQALVSGF
jgi:hypothetical protein